MARPMRNRAEPDEVRAAILEVAEEHFRRIGYQKTSVADIAAALKMSPANVYRFFPAKSAIVGAICSRVTAETQALGFAIAASGGTVAERLTRYLVEIHRHNKATLMNDERLHDMVSAAMEENWTAIKAHIEVMRGIVSGLIREGIETGEFAEGDPDLLGHVVKTSFAAFVHPKLIEQCCDQDMEPIARKLVDILVNGLKKRD
ncbi:TetR/AcrR family transcriptional regulator [Methylobrevis pamukkalensis]|uniref:DNA-binding transcriptional repressor AcrR n=1 Tax=Methylobrevis pamukkalensis TaxID=1439726 RepID=A0A1E3H6E2_9HYPH|nr:TetR/AcrR family transcriptional regulator [Methylobrevis pamukkalensis]ODN71890.1 DNA-binding transcriptional repressor AcrR [Methylobrevis pamukkalensis]